MAIEAKPHTQAFIEIIHSAIEKELKFFIEKEYEKLKEDFLENLEREKAQAIAGISLHIMEKINFQQMGETLQISIDKPRNDQK